MHSLPDPALSLRTPHRRHQQLNQAVMGFSCCICGSIATWESGWVRSEGEHRERDEGLVAMEPERDAGEESDLGVRRLDEPLRESGGKRDVDRGTVGGDAALE
jgi:hypothetical protein